MKIGKRTTDATKAAALYMLKNGLASYKEIAELSGRSRQIIRIWGGRVDAPERPKAISTTSLDPRHSVAPLIGCPISNTLFLMTWCSSERVSRLAKSEPDRSYAKPSGDYLNVRPVRSSVMISVASGC